MMVSVIVDPRFPMLLKQLRERQGLSLRQLAARVHFSHTYLWEFEAGRKQPTTQVAAALDAALNADNALACLVTEDPNPAKTSRGVVAAPGAVVGPVDMPTGTVLAAIESHRQDLEHAARYAWAMASARSPGAEFASHELPLPDPALVLDSVTRWVALTNWLYDAFVRSRPPLRRLCPERYARHTREAGASPFRFEATAHPTMPLRKGWLDSFPAHMAFCRAIRR